MTKKEIAKDIQCWRCKKNFVVKFYEKDYKAWQNGKPIDLTLSYLTAGDRELLLRGDCDTCFDEMFPGWDYCEDN